MVTGKPIFKVPLQIIKTGKKHISIYAVKTRKFPYFFIAMY